MLAELLGQKDIDAFFAYAFKIAMLDCGQDSILEEFLPYYSVVQLVGQRQLPIESWLKAPNS